MCNCKSNNRKTIFALLLSPCLPVNIFAQFLIALGSTDKISLNAVTYREEQKEKDISCSCRVPCKSKLETRLQHFFTGLGESKDFSFFVLIFFTNFCEVYLQTPTFLRFSVCATHPWKILFLGLFFITCTTIGIRKIDLTIDPVELWTSNGSRCREERQYFNEHFGPFYRIQQVIVTAKNLNPVRES